MFAREKKILHSDSESDSGSEAYDSPLFSDVGEEPDVESVSSRDWGFESEEDQRPSRRRRPVLSDSESDSEEERSPKRSEAANETSEVKPTKRSEDVPREMSNDLLDELSEGFNLDTPLAQRAPTPFHEEEQEGERSASSSVSSGSVSSRSESPYSDRSSSRSTSRSLSRSPSRSTSRSLSRSSVASDHSSDIGSVYSLHSDEEERKGREVPKFDASFSLSASEEEAEEQVQKDQKDGRPSNSDSEEDDSASLSEVEVPRGSFVSRSVSGESLFTQEMLETELKQRGIERFEFDVYAFLLYMNDLAAFLSKSDAVGEVAFRLARYINSVLKKSPMGTDVDLNARAINALADVVGEFDEMSNFEKIKRVGLKMDQVSTDTGKDPSPMSLSYAIPLVLSNIESTHPDVYGIVQAVYPAIHLSEATEKNLPYPLTSAQDVRTIYAKLGEDDDAAALKMFQAMRTRTKDPSTLPICLSMPVTEFERRLRETLGPKGLTKVTHSIPIEGEGVGEAYTKEVYNICDSTSEAFRRGRPFAVTVDDQPNSETAFYHMSESFE